MLCVLHLRSTDLPLSWGDVCCFICLTGWVTHDPSTGCLGRQPGGRGAARLQSPFPFRVFSPSPPLSSFPIPLKTRCKDAHFHNVAQNTKGRNLFHEIVGMVQPVRSPQEWGELWKRERERKPVRGERISIVRCALSPLNEVVARTPVDGSCVTALVKQIESRTSPQNIGKSALRDASTQTIRKRTTGKGHKKHNGKEQV